MHVNLSGCITVESRGYGSGLAENFSRIIECALLKFLKVFEGSAKLDGQILMT